MEKKTIEVIVGKKKDGPVDQDKLKTTAALPEPVGVSEEDGEVEGRYEVRTQMQCWRCSGVSWIWYDTDYYTDFTCCYCYAVNTL
jgi:hypothetical protein